METYFKQFLYDLISIASTNPTSDKEDEAIACVEHYLSCAGIDYQHIVVDEARHRSCTIARISRSHLSATKRNSPTAKGALTFCGHIDVVPVSPDERLQWKTPPFTPTRRENKLFGRGTCDMKGGIAAVATAMRNATTNTSHFCEDITFLVTCDEEDRMTGVRALLRYIKPQYEGALIIAEPTNMQLMTASRGRSFARCTTYGKTAHGSQKNAIQQGNAILQMQHFLNQIANENFDHTNDNITGTSFWQPLSIRAGVEPGIIPDRCTCMIDTRLSLIDNCQNFESRLQSIAQNCAHRSAKNIDIDILDKREPWITSDDALHVKILRNIMAQPPNSQLLAQNTFLGSTDGNVLAMHGYKPVILGPGDLACAHRANEYVNLDDVERACQIYRELITRWCESS